MMHPVRVTITKPLTEAEIFFLEKAAELLSNDTIDTYRLRLNNSKTILEEIKSVLPSVINGSIREFYLGPLYDEAKELLAHENELEFVSFTKDYLVGQLKLKKNDNDRTQIDHNKTYHVLNLLLAENNTYLEKVFNQILNEINTLNGLSFNPSNFHQLNRLIGVYLIELKAKGYSKFYLNNFIRSVFASNKKILDFTTAMLAVRSLNDRNPESFSVYFGFKVPQIVKGRLSILSKEVDSLSYADIKKAAKKTNSRFKAFVKQYHYLEFHRIKVSTQDYFQAGYEARKKIQNVLDVLFMGHSESKIELSTECFIVGQKEPNKGNTQNLSYRLDGKYASDQDYYEAFVKKVEELLKKPIDSVSLLKIYSGLRYLRLGGLVDDLENKLLNYWIAMEYIFSSPDSEGDKVERLRSFFKGLHSLSYLKRLFHDTHRSVENMNISTRLSKYDPQDSVYLLHPDTLNDLCIIPITSPLLTYRVYVLTKERFKDSSSIEAELTRHQNNLERNISRIYRVRNEIVHSAARDRNIHDITSHLRYYLIFVLNGFIDFCNDHPIDLDDDRRISLDDYFKISLIKLESALASKRITPAELLKMQNPIEYLS